MSEETARNVSRVAARRALLAWQGLLAVPGGPRPWRRTLRGAAGALEAVRRLQCVQVDPVSVVERNHQLVLQARVGSFRPADLDGLYAARQVFDYYANALCILPMAAFPALWPVMLQARENQRHDREQLAPLLAEILAHLRREGPTPARALGKDGPRLYGYGWDRPDESTKASNRAIDLLWLGGEIMVARRQGAEKWWDLTERVLPPAIAAELPAPPEPGPAGPGRFWSAPPRVPAVRDWLADRYAAGYGIMDAIDPRWGWQRVPAAERRGLIAGRVADGRLVPLRIEGVRREYFAVPALAETLAAAEAWEVEPLVSFLPPLDNLLWRRERLEDLFGFAYTWEVYTPVHKRRWGAYTMPILEGDRLIGRLSPRLDRKAGVLAVEGLWLEPDVKPDAHRCRRLARALVEFAAWHGAGSVRVERTEPAGLNLPL